MALDDDLYRIGTVASLTGIGVERLRAWDRRHGLAPAHRVGKTRYYSRAQLERLKRIKQLIDQGQPISSLVDLSDEQLAGRLTASHDVTGYAPRLGLIGPNLVVLEHQSSATVEVTARWANLNAFVADPAGCTELDVIAVQLPVVGMAPIEQIEAVCPNVRVVALYQFGTDKHLQRVRDHGVTALQWPAGWADIEQACLAGALRPLRAGRTAPRRFTDEQLIAIAASSTDPSQAPGHLVELITRLNAFAEFNLAWQGADEAPAAAAPLHERVHSDVTQARAQLETALAVLAEAEELIPGQIRQYPDNIWTKSQKMRI